MFIYPDDDCLTKPIASSESDVPASINPANRLADGLIIYGTVLCGPHGELNHGNGVETLSTSADLCCVNPTVARQKDTLAVPAAAAVDVSRVILSHVCLFYAPTWQQWTSQSFGHIRKGS